MAGAITTEDRQRREESYLVRSVVVFCISLVIMAAVFLLVDDIFFGLQGLTFFYGG